MAPVTWWSWALWVSWHVTINIWTEVAKRLQILLIPFLMLSDAVCCRANKFTKLMWWKTWEPGALYELQLKAVENLRLSLKGWRWLWELAAGLWQRAGVCCRAGCGCVLVVPLQLQAAHPGLWHRECLTDSLASCCDLGSSAQCCSGSLTDVAELLKRTKAVLVKIKCFLPMSSLWK